jgi:hypothetical protein
MTNQQNRLEKLTQLLEPGKPTITIEKGIGFTVNLQSYESARIDSKITITGSLDHLEEIKAEVDHQLEEEITKQIQDLVQQVDPNKTLLGHRK